MSLLRQENKPSPTTATNGRPTTHPSWLIHEGKLTKWLRQADVDAGNPGGRDPGPSTDEKNELKELRRRNRVLEQELEVMRRAAAYFGQAQIRSQ